MHIHTNEKDGYTWEDVACVIIFLGMIAAFLTAPKWYPAVASFASTL